MSVVQRAKSASSKNTQISTFWGQEVSVMGGEEISDI